MWRFLFVILALPGAAFAQAYDDYCADLWIVRNAVFDKAGYCFGSVLGQAAFDNSDCAFSSPPTLSPDAKRTVDDARQAEAEIGCRINSKVIDPAVMRRLEDLRPVIAMDDIPVPDFLESACIGYRGPASALRAGRNNGARVTGSLRPGDTLFYYFWGVDGWSFAVNTEAGVMGWMPSPGEADCTQFAG